MLRALSLLAVLCFAVACSGGGGGVSLPTPPAAGEARLAADGLEIGPGSTGADLVVSLARAPSSGATLLQVDVELPPQLGLPTSDRLQAARPLATLDGDFTNGRFRVVCGDAQNAAAPPLAVGPLFRLRLVPSSPRQPGTFTLRLNGLRASAADGNAVPVDANPTVVEVVVR